MASPIWQPLPQVLPEIATNMYRGKAIRQQLARGEQEAELLDLQIEAFGKPDPKEQREAAKFQAEWNLAVNEASVRAWDGTDGTDAEKSAAAIKAGGAVTEDYFGEGAGEIAIAEYNKERGGVFDIDMARAVVGGESDQLRTLSMEETLALPGMTESRARNSVIQEDQDGKIYIDDAPTGLTAEDMAARGGVSPSGISQNTIDFQNNVIGAVGAVQTGTELLIAADTSPEALGVPGGFMRFGANLVSGAKAIADWAGYEKLSLDETEKQTIGASAFNYDSIDYDKLGVSGAEAEKFRAGIYGIAFAAAVAEQGTRPTDKDIQQFIDQIGGRATSAQSFRETIVQFMRRQDRRLKTIADVKQIGAVDRDAAFSAWKPAFRSFMETYAETADKKTATNAETDERFIEMSPGKWEPF